MRSYAQALACVFNTRLDTTQLNSIQFNYLSRFYRVEFIDSFQSFFLFFFIEMCTVHCALHITTNFILTFIICRRNKWIRLEVLRLFIVMVSEHQLFTIYDAIRNHGNFLLPTGIFSFRTVFHFILAKRK